MINLLGGLGMKKFLNVMSAIFGALTIIFFVSSLNHLDRDTARFLGTSTTINIQGTIFCAACAVICALNFVGAIILNFIESNAGSSTMSFASVGIKTEDGGSQMISNNYWVCPNCKSRNPASKVECRECGHVR